MRRKRKLEQGGFTLVELMVSLTLFSFAIAGVLAVAVSMAQGYREQRQIIQTETTARSALDFIADAIRLSSPGVSNAVVTTSTAGPGAGLPHLVVGDIEDTEHSTGNCAPAGGQPQGAIRLFDGGTSAADRLEIVYASGAAVTTVGSALGGTWASNGANIPVSDVSNFAVGDRVLIVDTNGTNAHVAKITSIPVSGDQFGLQIGDCTITPRTYNRGDLIIRVFRAQFYICTSANVPFATCAATTDNIYPTLVMDPDGEGAAPAEPLADYVEDFQIATAVDESDGAGGAPNDSIDADEWGFSQGGPTSFTTATPRNLKAMRVTLIARAQQPLAQTTATYFRAAVENRAVAGTTDTYRRRILSSTVEIRNLGDGI